MSLLTRLAEVNDNDKNGCLSSFASTFVVVIPPSSAQGDNIDTYLATTLSDLAVRARLSLAAFVRLFSKSQSELWNRIIREGVQPKWTQAKPQTQQHRPKNHKRSDEHAAAVRRHVRKDQLEGRYLVFDDRVLELWPEVFISLVDVVGKAVHDTRMINDYSYPRRVAVNDFTDRENFQSIAYNPPGDIARRLHDLRLSYPDEKVLLMFRDVSGAFRHVPVHEEYVTIFSFMLTATWVIALSCGFGWCGSTVFYSLAATVINDIYEQAAIADDVLSYVVDHGDRCSSANLTLRQALATILDPTAINDKNFTEWRSQNKALGLLWDTAPGTGSIPEDKLTKALRLTESLIATALAPKSELNKLLGVFRHIGHSTSAFMLQQHTGLLIPS
ncbi:hypothetical protein PHMEG_00027254 [Phytophthora megakarya]|uniref:Reverse transcriptase domain-containing protein n=1 Tax=Phytophthora megakarya TaxID=4795 RepID=A0A225V7B0_9STRA|nr:hypothetical protein PHMEG_00027254 [Phytophthora megakarya]